MKLISIVIIFTYHFISMNAQDSCEFYNYYKAKFLYESKQYVPALLNLDTFLNADFCNSHKDRGFLLKSRLLCHIDTSDIVINLAYNSAVELGVSLNEYLKYPELANKINTLSDSAIIVSDNNYVKAIKDIDYYIKLKEFHYTDQLLRRDIDSIEQNSLWILDTTIKNDFIALIKKKGEIPLSINVGNRGEFSAYLLILHLVIDGNNDKSDFDYFNPLLLNAVKNGRYPPHYYANIVDRYYAFVLNEISPYGTVNMIKIKDKSAYADEVRSNRKDINWPLFRNKK